MGVHGLWNLLEPSGKPVTLESLENKVLAVDVSIWLHQVVKGFQDSQGNPLPNAHLLGLFHRICKLLFYKIRPVFVFDGGVPYLKRQTVEHRQQKKSRAVNDAERVREKLINNLIKHKAINTVLGNRSDSISIAVRTRNVEDDMFALPPAVTKETKNRSEEDEQSGSEDEYLSCKHIPRDLHSIDVKSEHFKSLPADVRHDILTELKETRKQNSWGQLHKMPKVSDDFSTYQMERLLKRRLVQVSLEETEKEMGGHTLSLQEMEEMLKERGVDTNFDMGKRIASDNVTRYIYITESDKGGNVQNKQAEAVKIDALHQEEMCRDFPQESINEISEILSVIEDGDFESDWSEEDLISNSESELCEEDRNLKLAKDFIFENSGLTQKQILKLIKQQKKVTKMSGFNKSIAEPSTSGLKKDITLKENVKSTSVTPAEMDEDSNSELGNHASLTNEESLSKIEITTLNNVTPVKEDEKPCSELGTSPSHTNEKSLTKVQINTVSSNSIDSNNQEKMIDVEPSAQKVIPGLFAESSVPIESQINSSDTSPTKQSFGSNVHKANEEHSKTFYSNGESIKVSENVDQIVQISSDSDGDFEEVDVPQMTSILENSAVRKNGNMLEITISKSYTEIKDDIFAEIFSKDKPKDSDHTEELVCSVIDAKNTSFQAIESKVQPSMVIDSNQQATTTSKAGMSEVSSCINPNSSQIGEVSLKEVDSELELVTKVEAGPKIKFNEEELHQMKDTLAKEQNILLSEKGKQDRLAASISEQMTLEAQELIQLFGLPYILAPMEAEAQCAFLDAVSLTEGTITDDSDIWLFGGQKVYKNFFNQKKHVIRFQAVDIQQYFKLTRQQLIALALLVGSDYTIGLQGVGPVTALEILSSFPCGKDDSVTGITEGLQKFREWWVSGSRMGSGGKAALRNKLRNIRLSEGFPNRSVVEAYFHPEVDQSKETFTWGSPDLAALRSYTQEKFGWNQKKADDILLPVMKKLNERNMQRSIDSYFQVKPLLNSIQGKLSKRVQKAVSQIDSPEDVELEPKVKRQRKAKVSNTQLDEQGSSSSGAGRGKQRAGKGRVSAVPTKQTGEFIMQRQKDKINALKNRLKAIEVYRKSKKGLDITAPSKKVRRKELPEARLSESSDSD